MKTLTALLHSLQTWEKVLLISCIVAGAFLYFFQVNQTLQFQGDQGRDALIVSRIFTQHDFVFIGPVTSVGNMYLGPLYYYFMLPFLWVTYPSPMGPVYAVGALALLVIPLLYLFVRKLFGPTAAAAAVILYTSSAVFVAHARFSWNPNPEPIVMLGMLFGSYKAWIEKDHRYWLLVSLCFSALLQLHYVTLITAVGALFLWMLSFKTELKKYQKKRKKILSSGFMRSTVLAIGLFLVSLTPLLLFDLKHDFLNARSFTELITSSNSFNPAHAAAEKQSSIIQMYDRTLQILYFELLDDIHIATATTFFLLEVLVVLIFFIQSDSHKEKQSLLLLLFYLVPTCFALGMYNRDVYAHYILFALLISVMLHGFVLAHAVRQHTHSITIVPLVLFLSAYIISNAHSLPLTPPSWTVSDIWHLSNTIADRVTPGEAYNISVINNGGDNEGMNYRYFLTTTNTPPLQKEEYDTAQTLFIINEMPFEVTNPTSSPLYEIVVFPNKIPAEVYTVGGDHQVVVLRR